MLDNCFTARFYPFPPSDHHRSVANGAETVVRQIAIPGHKQKGISTNSEIPARADKTILLRQKKRGETGTIL